MRFRRLIVLWVSTPGGRERGIPYETDGDARRKRPFAKKIALIDNTVVTWLFVQGASSGVP